MNNRHDMKGFFAIEKKKIYPMNSAQANQISIVSFLQERGFNQVKVSGSSYFFHSPIRKAETVATLSRDDYNGKRSTVFKPKFTRHKDFEEFSFSLDDNGKVLNTEIKSSYEPKNPKVEHLTNDQMEAISKRCFANIKNLPYSKMWQEVKSALAGIELTFGDNKSKDVLTRLKEKNYIGFNEETKHYFLNIPV